LIKIVREILPPSIEVFEEFVHTDLEFIISGRAMIFDIYVPSLKLAFEYQGSHHYCSQTMFGEINSYHFRDGEKRQACKSLDITLIEVPYWWQCDKESILAMLHRSRSDFVLLH